MTRRLPFSLLFLVGCTATSATPETPDPEKVDPPVQRQDPTQLGECDPIMIGRSFEETVFAHKGRCDVCHMSGAENRAAPKWIATGDDAAVETMYNLIQAGNVDVDEPMKSLMLVKPLAESAGGMLHAGGDVIADQNDPAYGDFGDWLLAYADCYGGTNQPPVPDPGVDRVVMEPRPGEPATVTLDASTSMDPDGSITAYDWTWTGGEAEGVTVTMSLAAGTHVITLTVTDDDGAKASATITVTVDLFPSECSDTAALEIYTRRVEPLVTGGQPTSCNQCHLSGMDLGMYVQDTPCQTMACLVESGEIDFDDPAASTILDRISRAVPESELITQEVIQAEYDGFLEWIQFNAVCQDALCGEITNACSSGVGNGDPTGVQTPLGGCDEDSIVDAFSTRVFVWRGRCEGCHTPGASGQCRPQWNGTCAPGFLDGGDPQLMAKNTMYNLIGLGAIDKELAPEQNPLILKPLDEAVGGTEHLGGNKINLGDPAYNDFVEWLGYYKDCYDGGAQQPPLTELSVRITNPPNGAVINNNPVYLQGHATDPEDGELIGNALTWRRQGGDGSLNGAYVQVDLPPGTHVITLTAADSDGNMATDTITITRQ